MILQQSIPNWNTDPFRMIASKNKRTAESNMLMGLGHDRIVFLGQQYIKRGYITKDEYENLHDYLYKPYSELGGNGTAAKVMKEVEGLSLREKEE